jgi:hypothetical protein
MQSRGSGAREQGRQWEDEKMSQWEDEKMGKWEDGECTSDVKV